MLRHNPGATRKSTGSSGTMIPEKMNSPAAGRTKKRYHQREVGRAHCRRGSLARHAAAPSSATRCRPGTAHALAGWVDAEHPFGQCCRWRRLGLDLPAGGGNSEMALMFIRVASKSGSGRRLFAAAGGGCRQHDDHERPRRRTSPADMSGPPGQGQHAVEASCRCCCRGRRRITLWDWAPPVGARVTPPSREELLRRSHGRRQSARSTRLDGDDDPNRESRSGAVDPLPALALMTLGAGLIVRPTADFGAASGTRLLDFAPCLWGRATCTRASPSCASSGPVEWARCISSTIPGCPAVRRLRSCPSR